MSRKLCCFPLCCTIIGSIVALLGLMFILGGNAIVNKMIAQVSTNIEFCPNYANYVIDVFDLIEITTR